MNKNVNEARRGFERESRRLTGKPAQAVTERLIDLIRDVRHELRTRDTK